MLYIMTVNELNKKQLTECGTLGQGNQTKVKVIEFKEIQWKTKKQKKLYCSAKAMKTKNNNNGCNE